MWNLVAELKLLGVSEGAVLPIIQRVNSDQAAKEHQLATHESEIASLKTQLAEAQRDAAEMERLYDNMKADRDKLAPTLVAQSRIHVARTALAEATTILGEVKRAMDRHDKDNPRSWEFINEMTRVDAFLVAGGVAL